MTRPRIFGMLCTRNEAGRYLDQALTHHAEILDRIFVWDDRSTDTTARDARRYATVEVRPPGACSFIEDESKFRQGGWAAMVAELEPRAGVDWILAFDADEVFYAHGNERESLDDLMEAAQATGADSVVFRVDEVFAVEPGLTQRRIDGFWGSIAAARFTCFNPEARFPARPLGGGSIPVFGDNGVFDATEGPLSIRHFGYARPEDRQAKYRRYAARPGHNRAHVESILQEPVLEPLR